MEKVNGLRSNGGGLMLDQERKTDVAQWMRRHGHLLLAVLLGMLLACQDSPPEVPSSHARPNILFLLIDALRADRLGCYGNPRATSPVLDAYSLRGVRFATVISQSSHTKLSVASIFTGLIPPSHGVRNAGTLKEAADKDAEVKSDVLSEGLTTVAELLQGRGYRTLAVVTNPHLLGKMGFAQGFESYVYKRHSTPARKINQEALRLLSEGGEGPFFLYTHYMDVHAPYDPPPEYAERFTRGLVKTDVVYVNGRYRHKLSADELAYSQAMYEAQIRYWDDEFGSFMRELGDRGYLDNTLVIIASDHGDEFYEHRGFGHGYTCYEEVLRVPLIMVWAGVLPEETL
jgi:arylsulfatase A-like enzyme